MDTVELSALLESGVDLLSRWGIRVLGALAVLVLGRLAAGWIRRAVRRGLERAEVDATLVPFLSGIAYALALAFVVLAVLGLFGIPTASLVAVLGAAAFAVGLALQGTLSNFSSGVMMLIFRPFKVGDYVEAGGKSGTVAEIGIFSTLLDTPDNVRVILPNSSVYGQTITNYSANDDRRIDLVVGVGYEDDLQVAGETLRRVLEEEERVLDDPAPVVAVSELGASSVDFVVRPWCRRSDYWQLRWDLTRRIKQEIEAAGCGFPFPQRDVHVEWAGEGPRALAG